MISKGTNLVVADNSGGKKVQCIHVLGSSKQRYATLGKTVLISAKKVTPQKKITKKKLYRALVIATKKEERRNRVTFIRFRENRVLLLSEQDKFLGTRIYGPICKEIRGGVNETKYKPIISYSRGTV
jgi:large subunit ribosomal protein L14